MQGELICSNDAGNKFVLGSTSDVDKVGTNQKHVNIVGVDSSSKLDFSSETFLMLNSAVTLRDIQVKWPTTRIYAEGNRFIVEESVVQTEDSSEVSVFAGSAYHDVARTDIALYSGTYKTIVGGQAKYTVGETHVTVGKNVNQNVDTSSHNYTYKLFGGSYSEGAEAVVSGNTYVTVEAGAKFNYVFGGGGVNTNATASTVVRGETYVDFAGDAYGVFGGGYGSAASGTHVKINGGTVYQVFGANEHASMTGNTEVQLLGGTVKRRVYGGCYNDSDSSWAESYQVTGYTSVIIGPNVKFSFSDNDQGVFAGSRYKSSFDGEVGTVIFLDDCYAAKKGVLGSQDFAGSMVIGTPEYHYLVKATVNGNVQVVGNKLYVVPKDGYIETVKQGSTTLSPIEEGGEYYALPELGSASKITIDITFSVVSE